MLDPEAAIAFAAEQAIDDASPGHLAAHPLVRDTVAGGVRAANAQLSRAEQIKRWTILPTDWVPGGDELTATMKLRRKPIARKYAAQIEAMYAQRGGEDLLAAL